MARARVMTFDEFRALWDAAGGLREDAAEVLLERTRDERGGWAEWPDGATRKRQRGWPVWEDGR